MLDSATVTSARVRAGARHGRRRTSAAGTSGCRPRRPRRSRSTASRRCRSRSCRGGDGCRSSRRRARVHSSPTKASTSRGSEPQAEALVEREERREVSRRPADGERVCRRGARSGSSGSSHLPLRSRDASTTPWTVSFSKPATRVSMPSRDLHRLEEAQAARLERVELRPRPDGRRCAAPVGIAPASASARGSVGFESAPRGTDTAQAAVPARHRLPGRRLRRLPSASATPAASRDAEERRRRSSLHRLGTTASSVRV